MWSVIVAYSLTFESEFRPAHGIRGLVQRGTGIWTPLENHKWLKVSLGMSSTDLPREAIVPFGSIASRGRSVRPYVKYVYVFKKLVRTP